MLSFRDRAARVVPLLALVVGVGAAVWLWPTETRRLTRLGHELAGLVSAPAGETELARTSRAARLARRLADDLVVGVDERPDITAGKEQVLTFVGRFFVSPGGITVTIKDVEVTVEPPRAHLRATATAREPDVRGGPDLVEVRDITLEFRRGENEWLLVAASVGLPELVDP